ncbi:hypothetical protein [Streptomyces sp. NBC_01439]|uniref:hypothetical protein n=1 Tax=Streptomyces sp. NBC_01439 TaxID=2903867 RepID=UPI002E29C75B|nr:hypothetical protein [Streptomyces sp. NBC_01439]
MSTPPNPPSTPVGPPTEPAGSPTPETESIPAPAQPLSLDKTLAAPATPEAPETSEAPTEPLSLDKTPTAPATPEAPETSEAPTEQLSRDETPATLETPAQPLSLDKTPTAPATPEAPAQTPSPEKTPATPEAPEAARAPEAPAAAAPEPAPAPSSFAPPSPPAPAPAPAAAFGTPAAPGAPGHTWGEPTPGFPGTTHPGYPGYAGYPGYPQAAPNNNGLAVAAVITGGFGLFFGIIPFLFWLGTLLAAVGAGLGIGGIVRANKGAPRKSMAVVGTVLAALGLFASVGGFFLTALVVDRADHHIDRQIEEEWGPDGDYPSSEPWPSKSPSPTQVPGLTSALPFGETFTYPNGIKVSLSTPTKYEAKGEYSRERIKNAVQLTVTITNGSSSPHEVIYAVPNVRDDQGMAAEMAYDSGNVPKMIRGSILPGETASGILAFEVPKGTKSITADISPGVMLDNVKYAGPIR